MSNYSTYLTEAISNGNVKFALSDLRNAINRYKEDFPDKAQDVHDLSIQVVMLSSRLQELEKRESMSTISADDAHIERSSVTYALLEIVNGWDQDFVSFANTLPHKPLAAAPTFTPPPVAHTSTRMAAPKAEPAQGQGIGSKLKWVGIGGGLLIVLWIIGSQSTPATTDPNTSGASTGTTIASASPNQSTGDAAAAPAPSNDTELLLYLAHTWKGEECQQYLDSPEAAASYEENKNSIHGWVMDFHKNGEVDVYHNGEFGASGVYTVENGVLSFSSEEGGQQFYIESITPSQLILIDYPSKYCRWILRAA